MAERLVDLEERLRQLVNETADNLVAAFTANLTDLRNEMIERFDRLERRTERTENSVNAILAQVAGMSNPSPKGSRSMNSPANSNAETIRVAL